MDQNLESGDGVRTGVATYIIDAAVAAVLLSLGILVVVTSLKLGAGWTSDGPGSGYFPFGIGVLICISGLGTMLQALFAKDKDREVFVDREQFKRVLQVFIPALFYVAAIEVLGVYISSAIYIALFMILLGKFSWIKAIIAAILTNVFFFGMFEIWFKVPLFKGSMDLLGFLGY